MDTEASLIRLEALTERLPDLAAVVKNETSQVIEYDVGNGIGYAVGLLNNRRIAVSNSTFSKGTYFPRHEHNEREILICYQGSMMIKVRGGEQVLGVGDSIVIEGGEGHAAEFLEDTRLICITVPSAHGFPSDGG